MPLNNNRHALSPTDIKRDEQFDTPQEILPLSPAPWAVALVGETDKAKEKTMHTLLEKNTLSTQDDSSGAIEVVSLIDNPRKVWWCGWPTLFESFKYNIAKELFPGVPVERLNYDPEKLNTTTAEDVLFITHEGPCFFMAEQALKDFPGKIIHVNGEKRAFYSDHERFYIIGPRADSKNSIRAYFGAMVLSVMKENVTRRIIDHGSRVKNSKQRFLLYITRRCVPYRENALKAISKIGQVHAGASCHGTNITNVVQETIGERWETNYDVFTDYRFALVMENSKIDGYITEKMGNAFSSGTVPIWYGTREVFDVFNERAFVYYDVENPQPALDRIAYLENNSTAYDEVLTEPILKNGVETQEKYFSFRDGIGGGKLKKRIRNMMGFR
jgi:hypothetical protein